MLVDADLMPLAGLLSTETDRRLAIQAEPLLVSAKGAAALCAISERLWRSWDSAGKVPAAVIAQTGVKRWLWAELRDWSRAGCPSRARWMHITTTQDDNKGPY